MQRQPPLFCLSLLRSCISWCSSCSSRTTGAGAAAAGAELRWTWRAGEGSLRGPRRTAPPSWFESGDGRTKSTTGGQEGGLGLGGSTKHVAPRDRTNGACFVPPPSTVLTLTVFTVYRSGVITFRLGWSYVVTCFREKRFGATVSHLPTMVSAPWWSQSLPLHVSFLISSLADLHFASFDWSRHASHDIPTISTFMCF